MANTDIRTDIQPSWLELPEEVYFAVAGPANERADYSQYFGLYTTVSDAERRRCEFENACKCIVMPISLEQAMRAARHWKRDGVRIYLWRENDWEHLATYDVADYFGGDRA